MQYCEYPLSFDLPVGLEPIQYCEYHSASTLRWGSSPYSTVSTRAPLLAQRATKAMAAAAAGPRVPAASVPVQMWQG